ncbi:MAG: response regulator transcription factor [Myxococcales bacterium]
MAAALSEMSVQPLSRPRPGRGDRFLPQSRRPMGCLGRAGKPSRTVQADVQPIHKPTPASVIRILLADDHTIVRDSLARLLQTHDDLQVIGTAGDGQQAVDLALDLRPDVVVMDISMPRLNGLQATRQIKASLPHTHVIGLSMHREEDMAAEMKAAGASHYLVKTSAPDDLVDLIRACCRPD